MLKCHVGQYCLYRVNKTNERKSDVYICAFSKDAERDQINLLDEINFK